MYNLDKSTIQETFDLVDTIKYHVVMIAEDNEPDYIDIVGPVWFDEDKDVFRVANVYHPGCDCCSFIASYSEVNYETVAKRIDEDRLWTLDHSY